VDKKEVARLIDKYVKDECLPDEKYILEKYLDSFQNDEFAWADKLHGEKQSKEDKIYLEIIRRMKREEKNIIVRTFYSSALIKVAASLLVMCILAAGVYFITGIFKSKPDVADWIERVTVPGEKVIITLNENSKIILNAESRLKYPSRFSGKTREVFLDGEAYFSVAHDTSNPFIVHAGDITTTVLGTKFNVSSYKDDGTITIALAEGKVKVSKENQDAGFTPVMLKPKEKIVYNKEDETGVVNVCDIQQETGWKDNLLKFKNEPLLNVVTRLERTYGVKFEFTDKSYYKQKITTNFQNATIWSISEVLKKLTGLPYKTIKENNEIKKIVFGKIKNKGGSK
jgi:ferric-dicitrate binding protein FerR (iron transport regulator)